MITTKYTIPSNTGFEIFAKKIPNENHTHFNFSKRSGENIANRKKVKANTNRKGARKKEIPKIFERSARKQKIALNVIPNDLLDGALSSSNTSDITKSYSIIWHLQNKRVLIQ